MRRVLSIISMLIISFLTLAQSKEETATWENAKRLYQQKKYDSCILLYQSLLADNEHNALLHYNLANAFYKANNIGLAIVHYEKSVFYQPNYKQAKENLLLAQSRIPNGIKSTDEIFFIRWWQTLVAGQYRNFWAMTNLFIFLLLCGLIVLRVKGKSKVPAQLFFILPLFLLLLMTVAFQSAQNGTTSTKAIVTSNNAIAIPEPNVYKGQIIVPEGTTVITGTRKGRWIAVTLPNKRIGWMQENELTFVSKAKN